MFAQRKRIGAESLAWVAKKTGGKRGQPRVPKFAKVHMLNCVRTGVERIQMNSELSFFRLNSICLWAVLVD